MSIDLNQVPVWIINDRGTIHTLSIYKSSSIQVHRHMDYPGKWLLSGRGVLGGIDKVILHSDTLEEAKEEAISRVHFSLNNITQHLGVMFRNKKG